ncbi:MAG: potassium-transporting ATPase subunit KdpC [Isosphaeraceae bacterium]|nr:potassium-transporting ATPase subunit KdpC [Isosphaeraceae bacterium]
MIRQTVHAVAACVVTFIVCAVAYPAVVWGLGWMFFPHQAEGSLIYGPDKTTLIGSELIAQPFASDKYFSPRPSAVDYKADAAGGSNLGTKNPDLHTKVKERVEALKATDANPAPVDLISASGSGLDPEISPEGAYFQAPRVAAARKLPVEQVRALIDRLTDRSGAIVGAPARVNVLKLNLALDEEKPASGPSPTDAEKKPSAASSSPSASPFAGETDERAAVRAAHVGNFRDRRDVVAAVGRNNESVFSSRFPWRVGFNGASAQGGVSRSLTERLLTMV